MDKAETGTMFCEHGMLRTRCKKCNPELAQRRGHARAVPTVLQSDRNLAFKCNWMDTDYEGPCTHEGRRYNIFEARRTWCTQPENPCYQLEQGIIDELPEFTCYEACIFSRLEFGAGVDHTGENSGRGRTIRYITPGKLALFTTRAPLMSEDEREIFGFFIINCWVAIYIISIVICLYYRITAFNQCYIFIHFQIIWYRINFNIQKSLYCNFNSTISKITKHFILR